MPADEAAIRPQALAWLHELILDHLRDGSARMRFSDLPEDKDVCYSVWVDATGAHEMSAVSPSRIVEGIVYVGECVEQSVRLLPFPRTHVCSAGIERAAASGVASSTGSTNAATALRPSSKCSGKSFVCDCRRRQFAHFA